jgi:hypothetical protein
VHQANVGVVIPANDEPIRVNLLNKRWHKPDIPHSMLPVPDADLLITVWWLTGLPDPNTVQRAYLRVLRYLHEIMLERSITDPTVKPIRAGLALAILRVLEAVEDD